MRHPLAQAALLLSALLLTVISSHLERKGPELAAYGNLCGPTHDQLCMQPRLHGGFPLAYLFDAPGISVEGQLSFAEDEFRTAPFLFDLAVYLAGMMVGASFVRRVCVRALSKCDIG